MAGGAVAARPLNLLENRGCSGQVETRTAILLRDQRSEEPGLSQGGDELGRVSHLPIEPPPVFARKSLADPADGLADLAVLGVLHRRAHSPPSRARQAR
jgi:hypothetical protein